MEPALAAEVLVLRQQVAELEGMVRGIPAMQAELSALRSALRSQAIAGAAPAPVAREVAVQADLGEASFSSASPAPTAAISIEGATREGGELTLDLRETPPVAVSHEDIAATGALDGAAARPPETPAEKQAKRLTRPRPGTAGAAGRQMPRVEGGGGALCLLAGSVAASDSCPASKVPSGCICCPEMPCPRRAHAMRPASAPSRPRQRSAIAGREHLALQAGGGGGCGLEQGAAEQRSAVGGGARVPKRRPASATAAPGRRTAPGEDASALVSIGNFPQTASPGEYVSGFLCPALKNLPWFIAMGEEQPQQYSWSPKTGTLILQVPDEASGQSLVRVANGVRYFGKSLKVSVLKQPRAFEKARMQLFAPGIEEVQSLLPELLTSGRYVS